MKTASRMALLLALGATGCATTSTEQPAPAPAVAQAPAPAAAPASPKPPEPPAYLTKLPPLVDREVFFADPEISSGEISPDGKFISFRKPYKGVMNIWVKGINEPFDAARPLTADTQRPIPGYFWSRDGKYLVFSQDKGGDENFHLYAVSPTDKAEASTGVPPARDLTPLKNVRAQIVAGPKNDPKNLLIGLNDRDPQLHDVYKLNLETGKRTLIFKNEANLASFTADRQGKLRLATRQIADGSTEVLRIDGNKLVNKPIYTCGAQETCGPVRFHKDGKRVYFVTDKGERNFSELVLVDLATGKETLVDRDPEGKVDFEDARFSDVTEELIATEYLDDRLRIYPKAEVFKKDYETVRKALPEGDLYFTDSSRDESLWLVAVTSDVDPGAVYLYRRATGKVELLYRPYPNLPLGSLASMKPVVYPARDGVEIHAYLTVPKNVEAKNLPTILLVHGGPWMRDAWGYEALAQFLANRGYAVLQPNFRGSSGYGKKFLNLGNKQWGTGTMQHDLTDAVKYLVDQGIADPKQVAIMGGSYGGYATLAGVAFTPDLYAAGVDIVGPSNIITLLNSIPPYWAPLKKMFALRVGDVDDPKDQERLKAQSPLFSADKIKAPLLVIQGANDPRVKRAESDRIVMALRDLGRPVAYLVAEDEGHGYHGRENRIASFVAIERFLHEHLRGRVQESVSPELQQKLAKLTIDPRSLSTKPAEPASGASAPAASFSGDQVVPARLRYQQTLNQQGHKVDITSVRTIAEGKEDGQPVWLVSESIQTPGGTVEDVTVLDRKTLQPVKRNINQGGASIALAFPAGRVEGQMKQGPNTIPLSVKVDGPVFLEGAPLYLAVATLKLEAGTRATVQVFDLGAGKTKPLQVEIKGAEKVEVPAGAFDAVRVELTSADDAGLHTTAWLEKAAPHRLVQARASLPTQMGGGDSMVQLAGDAP